MTEFALLEGAARQMSAQRTLLDVAARNVAAAQASTPGHAYSRLVASIADTPSDDPSEGIEASDDDSIDPESQALPISVVRSAGTGDALTELIAVLDAQRAYEANASIFDIGKRLAERTLDVDR